MTQAQRDAIDTGRIQARKCREEAAIFAERGALWDAGARIAQAEAYEQHVIAIIAKYGEAE